MELRGPRTEREEGFYVARVLRMPPFFFFHRGLVVENCLFWMHSADPFRLFSFFPLSFLHLDNPAGLYNENPQDTRTTKAKPLSRPIIIPTASTTQSLFPTKPRHFLTSVLSLNP